MSFVHTRILGFLSLSDNAANICTCDIIPATVGMNQKEKLTIPTNGTVAKLTLGHVDVSLNQMVQMKFVPCFISTGN